MAAAVKLAAMAVVMEVAAMTVVAAMAVVLEV